MAPRTAKPPETELAQLQAQFAAGEHKARSQGNTTLTYVDISATINRVNAVLGAKWSILPATKTTILPTASGSFGAMTEVYIEAVIDGTTKYLYGVGAMTNKDPDMACKTALAEAIKKAWHQAGVALYLWDKETRDQVQLAMEALESPAARRKALKQLAARELGIENPTGEQVNALFELGEGAPSDEDVTRILTENGVL